MRLLLSIVAMALLASPAAATGSLGCSVADKALELTVEGAFSSGVGAGLVNAGGSLLVRLTAAPPATSPIVLERADVTQFWLDGPVMKLRIWRDIGSDIEADVIVEVQRSKRDETEYSGTYKLELTLPPLPGKGEARYARSKGKITCSVG